MKFPPLAIAKREKSLVVLATPRRFVEALWTAYGWMRFLSGELSLLIAVDGVVSDAMRRSYARCFHGGEVRSVTELIGGFSGGSRHIDALVKQHFFGRKLALLVELNQTQSLLYSDNDVVIWECPEEVVAAIHRNQEVVYNAVDDSPFSPLVRDSFLQRGRQLNQDFNSGLIFLPQGRLDLSMARSILEEIPPEHVHHFIEQAMLAGLCSGGPTQPLPQHRYSISTLGAWIGYDDLDYAGLVGRHFVGPVRHRMYEKGYPRLRDRVLAGR